MRPSRGFTLIELLVVVAIIGLMVGLLLPAILSAREAARRSSCSNNFRQVGLALQAYHDAQGSLPIGRTGLGYTYDNTTNSNRRTWVLGALPYIEQGVLANAYNFSLSLLDPPNFTTLQSPVATFICPSDSPSVQEPDTFARAKGSVAANWGGTTYYQNEPGRGAAGPNPFNGPAGVAWFAGAPFMGNRVARLGDFADGASNTVLVGETVIGQDSDHRGDIYNDDHNCTMFMAYTPPNSPIPDQMVDYCVNSGDNPPCNALIPAFNATRSWHPGGIHALCGDGGVRFVKDSIEIRVWRALATPGGGELVTSPD